MKIAYIVVRTDHASVYYRTLQFLPPLAERGMEATVITLSKGFYDRLSAFRNLDRYDLVVLQRKLFNLPNFVPLRGHARRLIFDVDDALFLRDSKSRDSFSLTRTLRFRRTARRADLVICGNPWIEERVKRWTSRTAVIPTAVDLDAYAGPKKHEGFRAVWIGGRSTLFYLENLLPHLEPLAREIRGFKLRVISDAFPSSDILEIEKIPWSRNGEVEAIREGDVGLMPLTDDAWSRGKCGLKLLQYGACGLPSICSPFGVNEQIVEHGASGFQARDGDQWQKALLTLAGDAGLRAEYGARAREIVAGRYSVQALVDRYARLLEETAQPFPPSSR
jgi:glycosyltransferase involved in cell wall biosynthesis